MIEINCVVNDYSEDSPRKGVTISSVLENNMVEINVYGETAEVDGRDLIEAVKNCMNKNF